MLLADVKREQTYGNPSRHNFCTRTGGRARAGRCFKCFAKEPCTYRRLQQRSCSIYHPQATAGATAILRADDLPELRVLECVQDTPCQRRQPRRDCSQLRVGQPPVGIAKLELARKGIDSITLVAFPVCWSALFSLLVSILLSRSMLQE